MKNCANFRSNTMTKTLYLVYTAILISLSLVTNMFTIASGKNAFSFAYIPSFIAGIFLGPISGLATGLLGDVLGCIIAPKGPWVPLITLSSALIGLIPGLICKIPKLNIYIKIWLSIILCYVFCTCGFNTLGLYLTYSINSGKTFFVYLGGRIAFQSLMVFSNGLIITLLYYPIKKLIFDKSFNRTTTESDVIDAELEIIDNECNCIDAVIDTDNSEKIDTITSNSIEYNQNIALADYNSQTKENIISTDIK